MQRSTVRSSSCLALRAGNRRRRARSQLPHLVGLRADVALRVFETRDGAVAEAAHHRHQRVEVLQLQQLLSTGGRKY